MHIFRRCRGMKMVVFDMAGTVINEGGMVYTTLYETIKNFGLSIKPQDIEPWHGANKYEVLDHFLNKETTDREFMSKRHILRKNFEDNLKQCYFSNKAVTFISPEIPDMFNKMRQHGIHVCLNTGYSEDIQRAIIYNLRLNTMITGYVASDMVAKGRPAPLMIQRLMTEHNVASPLEVMKVGDTPNDILEGRNADCAKVLGVLSGTGTRKSLLSAGADDILVNITELQD